MARAMVLCAGLGTRLRPLTEELPKPLVPIGDRSVLAHIAESLTAAGISELVINTHHLAAVYSSKIRELNANVQVIHEPEILGTAGGVHNARHLLGPCPVLVWNGDILTEPPLAKLLRSDSDGLCLAVALRAKGEGTVGIGAGSNVVRLRGETFGEEQQGGDYIGVAALGERGLSLLPERGCLIGDVALPELRSGGKVSVVISEAPWSDIGDVEAYATQNFAWLARQQLPRWIHHEAVVSAAVKVQRSLVHRGARIEGSGELRNVVVWPGGVVRAPLANAIVLTSGRIVPLGDSAAA